jgi:sugar/nucleoside kinase (ribokinase family)
VIGALGDLVEDIAVRLDGPVNLATDTDAHIRRRRGGSAANTAVAVVRAGWRSRFIGQVGGDPIGSALLATMESDGVELCVRRGGSTGTIIVLVDHVGERTMLTDRGSCADLDDPSPVWLDGLSVLHVPAYSLFGGRLAEAATVLIGWAHERGIAVSIDASSVALITAHGATTVTNRLAQLSPHVLLCNEDEAAALGGLETLRLLAAVAVIKRGSAPATVATPAGASEVPVPPIERVADTTGAGDAFAAGFLIAAASGASPVEAALSGHRCAGAAIAAVSSDG